MTARQRTVSKILELKEFSKEQLEAEVTKARQRLAGEQSLQTALEREYERTADEFAGKQMSGTLPARQMDFFYAYLKHLDKQIDLQKGAVAVRAAELDKTRAAMIESYKEHRLFTLLKDKMSRDMTKEADRGEQKQADFQFLSRKGKT